MAAFLIQAWAAVLFFVGYWLWIMVIRALLHAVRWVVAR